MVLPGRAKRWIPKTVVTPDYTNQLDLFSEAPIDDPAPVATYRRVHTGASMPDHDRLSSLILEHWSRYHPSMLAQLQQQNRLEQELEETAERFATSCTTWCRCRRWNTTRRGRLAMQEILLPEESSST